MAEVAGFGDNQHVKGGLPRIRMVRSPQARSYGDGG